MSPVFSASSRVDKFIFDCSMSMVSATIFSHSLTASFDVFPFSFNDFFDDDSSLDELFNVLDLEFSATSATTSVMLLTTIFSLPISSEDISRFTFCEVVSSANALSLGRTISPPTSSNVELTPPSTSIFITVSLGILTFLKDISPFESETAVAVSPEYVFKSLLDPDLTEVQPFSSKAYKVPVALTARDICSAITRRSVITLKFSS